MLMSASAVVGDESSTNSSSTTARDKAQFSSMDADHDRYISRAEAEQGRMADYSGADKNNDGRVDEEEFTSALNSRSTQGDSSAAMRDGSSSSSGNSSQHGTSSSGSSGASMGQSSETSSRSTQ